MYPLCNLYESFKLTINFNFLYIFITLNYVGRMYNMYNMDRRMLNIWPVI